MVTCIYSVKGGVGATTFTAMSAIAAGKKTPTVVIDLCGDLPMTLGFQPGRSDGVYDWLYDRADGASPSLDLGRIAVPVADGLSLISTGNKARWCGGIGVGADQERFAQLATTLLEAATRDGRAIIVDVGTLPIGETFVECWAPSARLRWELALRAPQRVAVTRACYLGLRAASSLLVPPTEIVFVREPGRALARRDIETAFAAKVGLEVQVDESVARSVDSGLLGSRLPKALRRTVERVVAHG